MGGCIVGGGGRPDREALERMLLALAHRGPDDSGIEVVENVGLVHARLSIVDPSPAGHQPMAAADGRWWLTYNGEIFNHLELREQLPPARYRGGSDTETLLHALGAWSDDAVPRCNGLYAYAAFDRDRARVLLVRDRFGVKPLYYATHAGTIWFASEIAALLAAGVPRRPDVPLVRHMVSPGWVNGADTPVQGVRRLLPGRVLTIDCATLGTRERTWYEPAAAVDPGLAEELDSMPRPAQVSRVRDALEASVQRRLMGDAPIGVMCSGGLDSSLISALAVRVRPDIHAFNAAIDDQPDVDEGPWAEAVADALGIELHTVRLTGASWRAGLVEAAVHNEYALVHESSVAMACIARQAHDAGVKVLLSGEGADELFGGYEWLHAEEYRDFEARHRLLEAGARSLYRRRQRLGRGPSPRGLGCDPREAAADARIAERAGLACRHHRGARGRLEAALLTDLNGYLPHLLNRQDKNTMQHSIETRVPFLDPAVVSLAVNLPLETRVEPERKAVLREVALDMLPPQVASRPKIGFGFDIDSYLKPALRPGFLEDGMLREFLDLPGGGWREHVRGLSGQALLLHVTGEIWCRALLDGQHAGAIDADLWSGGP